MEHSTPLRQHVFEDTSQPMSEVFWARIHAGFHFLHSLADGLRLHAPGQRKPGMPAGITQKN